MVAPTRSMSGVAQITITSHFHALIQYQVFFLDLVVKLNKYCEIYKNTGHSPQNCQVR